MSNSIISKGKTTVEAIEKGLKELNTTKDKVEINILEETEKRSFYNILSPRIVRVEMTLKEGTEASIKEYKEKNKNEKKSNETNQRPVIQNQNIEKKERIYNQNIDEINEAKEAVEKFLLEFLSQRKEITYNVELNEFEINIDIQGENVNYLIGYRGETINAIQTILTSIANKKSSEKIKIYLDIVGYKEKRMKTLEELAEKIAKTVVRNKKTVVLEPMTAYERKIIHTKLQSHDQVKTLSKGEEPYRKVVITLK